MTWPNIHSDLAQTNNKTKQIVAEKLLVEIDKMNAAHNIEIFKHKKKTVTLAIKAFKEKGKDTQLTEV